MTGALIALILVTVSQKLSLMKVKQRQYRENLYSYLCLILNKCNLNTLKFGCPMLHHLNVGVLS